MKICILVCMYYSYHHIHVLYAPINGHASFTYYITPNMHIYIYIYIYSTDYKVKHVDFTKFFN